MSFRSELDRFFSYEELCAEDRDYEFNARYDDHRERWLLSAEELENLADRAVEDAAYEAALNEPDGEWDPDTDFFRSAPAWNVPDPGGLPF